MTLEQAIAHCKEKAEEQREKATAIAKAKEPFYKYAECKECAKEHEQLAEWLEELAEWRKLRLICANDGVFVYRLRKRGRK